MWNKQILKDVPKGGNQDVNQDVPNNMYDMLVTGFPTQRKDEQVALVKTKVDRNILKMSDYGINAEATVDNNVSTLRRKNGEKRLHVDVSFTHMDNTSSHSKTNVKKMEVCSSKIDCHLKRAMRRSS